MAGPARTPGGSGPERNAPTDLKGDPEMTTEPATDAVECMSCGDPLHREANAELDEFVYVDEHGNMTGLDADLRRFGPTAADAYDALAALERAWARSDDD